MFYILLIILFSTAHNICAMEPHNMSMNINSEVFVIDPQLQSIDQRLKRLERRSTTILEILNDDPKSLEAQTPTKLGPNYRKQCLRYTFNGIQIIGSISSTLSLIFYLAHK